MESRFFAGKQNFTFFFAENEILGFFLPKMRLYIFFVKNEILWVFLENRF